MSAPVSAEVVLIEKLLAHLKAEGYSLWVQQCYPAQVRRFLDYCRSNALSIEAVRSIHVTRFLRGQYRLFRRRHSESLPFQKWRHRYTGALNMLLRLVHGKWPIQDPPRTALEAFHREIVSDYDAWLRDLRGLCAVTRSKRATRALQFLMFLGRCADQENLALLSVREIDAYVQRRCRGLRRASIEDLTVCLRDFLRHLHRRGHTASDLSGTVIGPHIYDHEGIPSALGVKELQRVMEVARTDLSPRGIRDYAILMLLTTYGLRAAEIIRLRLEDIDWRRDLLRVRHAKTETYSELPLFTEPGEALLRYLRMSRPRTAHKEIFLRIQPSHRPLKSLSGVTRLGLRAAGVHPKGRKGTHAFRHARAVSLLRSGASLKVIGDILGHTSANATAEYLKLATEDLRSVCLDLPGGVSP